MINEKLLHFIWQNQLIKGPKLELTDGTPIRIKKRGVHNFDAGPDFKDAQVVIGQELWAGHIEIHVHAKDWIKHGHQNDENYKSVILHVVLFDDYDLGLPTLELNGRIRRQLLDNYNQLMEHKNWVACSEMITDVSEFTKEQMKNRLIIERFERKTAPIHTDLSETANNWDEAFYRNLIRYAGLKVNKETFNQLGRKLPFKLINKHRDNLFQVESLLFGVAGFLNEINDEYQKQLQKEYVFLKEKYKLTEIDKKQWQFATLRPANFPTIRLAQMASLFCNESLSFSKLIESVKKNRFSESLDKVTASSYWDTHYHFNKTATRKHEKHLGKQFKNLLIINHFLPIIYAFGAYKDNYELKELAIDCLTTLGAESNSITKNWLSLGLKNENAFDSQALIELKTNYCDMKKCLNCSIGFNLLRKNA